jgi:hypothetical protein
MSAKVSYAEAVTEFKKILGFKTIESVIELTDGLQDGLFSGSATPFITKMRELRVYSRTSTTSVGAGAYGTIMLGEGKTVFKEIAITGNTTMADGTIVNGTYDPAKLDRSLRKVFFEAWIQTVLGLDATVGSNIAEILGVYKRASSSPYNDKFITIVIEMKLLGDSVEDYIKPGAPIEFSYIQDSVINLIDILQHLNSAYGFVHRDLHANNVMFNGRRITLIDFGLSCFTFLNSKGQTVKYAAPGSTNKGACQSFDMYIFLASLLYPISRQYLSEACIEKIKSFFDVVTPYDGTVVNLFKAADVDPYRNSVFHHFYEWHIRDLLSYIPADQQSPAAHLANILGLVSGTASVSGGVTSGTSNSASASSVTATGTVGKVTAAELAASGPMTSAYGCEGGCLMRWLGLRGGRTRRRYKKKGRTQKRRRSTFRH